MVFPPNYGFPPDLTDEEIGLILQLYTMTAPDKIFALIDAIRYIKENYIQGDIVECGVWKGGSMMAAAKNLVRLKDTCRAIHLFDTFAGMPEPLERDADYSGTSAQARLENETGVQAYAPLTEVRRVMESTEYPHEKIRYVEGNVEETIPAEAPDCIALLRLDTDWYESTRHELIHLFPCLSTTGGVLIVDGYGEWKGSRLATDEYFSQNAIKVFLVRIESGRIAVKQ